MNTHGTLSRHPKDIAEWLDQQGTTWPMISIPIDRIAEYFEKIVRWDLQEWRDWVMLPGDGPFGQLTHRRVWFRDPQFVMMLKLSFGEHA